MNEEKIKIKMDDGVARFFRSSGAVRETRWPS